VQGCITSRPWLPRAFILLPVSIVHPNVALLVHSCDRYEFLFKGFSLFFNEHWDFKTDCAYYFATEEKTPLVAGFQVIQSGKGAWADRLAILLSQKLTQKYVLYFQEDMWLNKPVDSRFFEKLFELAEKNNWQQVKLHSSAVYQTSPTADSIEGFVVASVDKQTSDFLMSHQVTLWNREFLLQQLRPKEHPWRNERNGTKRLRKTPAAILQLDYFAENGNGPLNANENLIARSEYQTISVNGTLNDNVQPYIQALAAGDASQQQYAAELAHHYANSLTHDGQPRPRKEDIFKRLANWFRARTG
jgi:hypothetical protein